MRTGVDPNKALLVLGLCLTAVGIFKSLAGELNKDDGLSDRARMFGAYPLDGEELDEKYIELREAAARFEDTTDMEEQYRRECQLSLGKRTSDLEDQANMQQKVAAVLA